MKLSEIKNHLTTASAVNFQLPNGTFVPKHFHVTEVGVITKDFIDCGGMVRHEKVANFQLWEAGDFDHLSVAIRYFVIMGVRLRCLHKYKIAF